MHSFSVWIFFDISQLLIDYTDALSKISLCKKTQDMKETEKHLYLDTQLMC